MKQKSDPVATLPMYDWRPVRGATDRLWAAVAASLDQQGIAAPATLSRDGGDGACWADPGLVLSQTCGYPLVTNLAGKVLYVATPHYDAPGCDRPNYCSVLIGLKGEGRAVLADFAGTRIAYNSADSLSGSVSLRAAITETGHDPAGFGQWVKSGSHIGSIEAVANGAADLAAIDAVAFALAGDHMVELVENIQVIGQTPALPGLPFITATGNGSIIPALRAALSTVLSDPSLAPDLATLRLTGLSVLPVDTYDAVTKMAERAE